MFWHLLLSTQSNAFLLSTNYYLTAKITLNEDMSAEEKSAEKEKSKKNSLCNCLEFATLISVIFLKPWRVFIPRFTILPARSDFLIPSICSP